MPVATSRSVDLPQLRDPRPAASRVVTRVCDAGLALCVLGLGAWTVAYHVCLVLQVRAGWSLAALAVALAPCVVFAARSGGPIDAPLAPSAGEGGGTGRARAVVAVVAAVAAAFALAFARWPWPATWAVWTAAAVAVAVASTGPQRTAACRSWAGAATALAWSAGLATLSLFLVRTDADDAYYLRQATWIAEHGRFPLGDTLHSHDTLPAVFSPPIS